MSDPLRPEVSPTIYTVDFETYYSREYSLSVMTTESYIRDPQFEVMGASLSSATTAP